jgi:hypothetical protein
LVALWQLYWMTVALSAVDAPKMSTQLPAVRVATVKVSPWPATGVKVKRWAAAPVQARWTSCSAWVLAPPGTSAHWPEATLTAVLVKVVAASARPGRTAATRATAVTSARTAAQVRRPRRIVLVIGSPRIGRARGGSCALIPPDGAGRKRFRQC